MKLNVEILQTAYDFIASCPPYSSWNLPASEDVAFKINGGGDLAWYSRPNGKHTIGVSSSVTTVGTLMWLMAHEMIHLHENETEMGTRAAHSTAFRIIAKKVCADLGFLPDVFMGS